MTLTRDALLAYRTSTVKIPDKGEVRIRQISAGEYAQSLELVDGSNERQFVDQAAFVIAHGLVEPEFGGDEWPIVRDMLPTNTLAILHEKILEFSGLGAGSADEPMAAEAREVNARAESFPEAADGAGDGDSGAAVVAAADGETVELPAE